MKDTVSRERARVATADRAALAPYTVWAVLFILVPLVFVAYYAFTDNAFHFTLDNVKRFFTATSTVVGSDGSAQEVRTYLLIFWRSLKLAVISTVICLAFGYPIAYIMARAAPRVQRTFMTIIMIPMWMNFLIRTYAWMTILQDKGIFNNFLTTLHLPAVHIIGTEAAVVIGMVYDYFPYMILPLYSILAKLDPKLLEAARWIEYLKPTGTIVTNTQQMEPMPVIAGLAKYPENLVEKMGALGATVDAMDCLALAEQAGSPKAVNMVLMGRLSHYFPDIPAEAWQASLEANVPPKVLDLNKVAFALGQQG